MTQDELRSFLEEQGFNFQQNILRSRTNQCDWLAYRRIANGVKYCETNDNKVQFAIYPFYGIVEGVEHNSVEVDITGEAFSVWFKLLAYSIGSDELRDRLKDIEHSLIAAWNALPRSNA